MNDESTPVRVWDLPTRIFHWTLAVSVLASIVSAWIGGNAMDWHLRFGFLAFTVVAVPMGKVSFEQKALLENGTAVIEAVVKARPATAKGKFVHQITMSSTMSPGLRVDATPFLK